MGNLLVPTTMCRLGGAVVLAVGYAEVVEQAMPIILAWLSEAGMPLSLAFLFPVMLALSTPAVSRGLFCSLDRYEDVSPDFVRDRIGDNLKNF